MRGDRERESVFGTRRRAAGIYAEARGRDASGWSGLVLLFFLIFVVLIL